MKTRRNHRHKTTTGRRKRHVKHRVQTRINHRKGTVSSGRRHKFLKRGGTTPFDRGDTTSKFGTYDNGSRIPSLSQINIDKEEEAKTAAAKAAAEAAKPIEQNYPDVDEFVNKINAVYVSGFFESKCNLTIQKLPQIRFSNSHVKSGNRPVVIKTINEKPVNFYISFDGCNIDIYIDEIRYGRVVPIKDTSVIDTEKMCSTPLMNAITLDLITANPQI
jgi:hypothetical protein